MSHYLEQLAGRERRALCCANDAAMAIVHIPRGNLRTAQNDEPEPTFAQIHAEAQAEARAVMRSGEPVWIASFEVRS